MDPIRIGIIFSQTGSMSVSEQAHIQGALLACEEINESGGINGQPIEPIVVNPDGDDRKYRELATDLLLREKVNVIFGCCLSSSRKAVLPVVEQFNGILFYPSVYEGFEYSPNVIYGGAVPNQVVVPLLEYIFGHHGKRIALIGSDTLYAREVNRIVNEFLSHSGGVVLDELYLPFDVKRERLMPQLEQLANEKPDAIISTVVGEDSVTLYNSFHELGLSGEELPIASLTTTESELAKMKPAARVGHISVLPYFADLKTASNEAFVSKYTKRYPTGGLPCVYSEVCYALVHIYADAVRQSLDVDTNSILEALSGAVFKGPSGDMFLDLDTNHFTLRPHIGVATEGGHFDVVWRSSTVISPDPYLVAYDRFVKGKLTA